MWPTFTSFDPLAKDSQRIVNLTVVRERLSGPQCRCARFGSQFRGPRQTGKDGSVVNGQRVLVVDGMHEIQDVLRAVLAPLGFQHLLEFQQSAAREYVAVS